MKLQEARKAAGLTQAELAKLSGVNINNIREYEYGRKIVDTARLATIVALADALQVPMYKLLEDNELADKVKQNVKREA